MKISSRNSILVTTLLPLAMPLSGAAAQKHHHHYKLIDLGTFGGPTSQIAVEPEQNVINCAGTIVGGADTLLPTPEPACYNPILSPDCFIFHAFAWRRGHPKDLGTLRGGNFSWALEINQRGQIVGASETNQVDPTTGEPEFHAVL